MEMVEPECIVDVSVEKVRSIPVGRPVAVEFPVDHMQPLKYPQFD